MSTPYDEGYEAEIPEGEEFDESLFDEEEVDPEEEARFQSQMSDLVNYYEAEQDEFNDAHADFIERYGFKHDCRCAEDWNDGNLGVVSMCYLGMATDAMNTLADKIKEVKELNRDIARLKIELADHR